MLSSKLLSSIGNTDQLYVDDVFSAYTYTGNGSTQTINNGIDLAGKGGLVWTKARTNATYTHSLIDTVRGLDKNLGTSVPNVQYINTDRITSVSATGFSVGASPYQNQSGQNFVSWTFRKAPKFFDVVTWTGNGANRTIPHALGQEVGMIIIKRTDATSDWQVYHRSLTNTEYMVLNSTAAKATGATWWNSTRPTTSVFSLGTDSTVNASGGTYVAYLFASLPGISKVGSYTGNGSSQTINCGFSAGARFVLIKRTDSTGNWLVWDTARGIVSANDPHLSLNTTAAEVTTNDSVDPDGTGFIVNQNVTTNINVTSATYLYLAIS